MVMIFLDLFPPLSSNINIERALIHIYDAENKLKNLNKFDKMAGLILAIKTIMEEINPKKSLPSNHLQPVRMLSVEEMIKLPWSQKQHYRMQLLPHGVWLLILRTEKVNIKNPKTVIKAQMDDYGTILNKEMLPEDIKTKMDELNLLRFKTIPQQMYPDIAYMWQTLNKQIKEQITQETQKRQNFITLVKQSIYVAAQHSGQPQIDIHLTLLALGFNEIKVTWSSEQSAYVFNIRQTSGDLQLKGELSVANNSVTINSLDVVEPSDTKTTFDEDQLELEIYLLSAYIGRLIDITPAEKLLVNIKSHAQSIKAQKALQSLENKQYNSYLQAITNQWQKILDLQSQGITPQWQALDNDSGLSAILNTLIKEQRESLGPAFATETTLRTDYVLTTVEEAKKILELTTNGKEKGLTDQQQTLKEYIQATVMSKAQEIHFDWLSKDNALSHLINWAKIMIIPEGENLQLVDLSLISMLYPLKIEVRTSITNQQNQQEWVELLPPNHQDAQKLPTVKIALPNMENPEDYFGSGVFS